MTPATAISYARMYRVDIQDALQELALYRLTGGHPLRLRYRIAAQSPGAMTNGGSIRAFAALPLYGDVSVARRHIPDTDQQAAERLLDAIAAGVITQTEAEIVWLRAVEGAMWQDVAQAFGLSLFAAGYRYRAAMQRLRKEYGASG